MADIQHIGQLKPDQKNARRHTARNIGMIVDALHEVGAARSIVIDENYRILAGNGTIDAAAEAGIEKMLVVPVDGETIVAVQRTGLTEAQKTRLALFDNRASDTAEWDASVLAVMAEDGVNLDDLWAPDELDALLADVGQTPEPGDGGDEFDATPEDGPTTCQPGDIWALGPHRLLCGDSTESRLTATDGATLIFDPPWDAGYTLSPGEWRNTLAFTDGGRIGDVVRLAGAPTWLFAWDCVSSWYTPNRPLRRMKLCAWYGPIEDYDFNGAHYGDGGNARDVFNSRGSYRFIPDPRGKHLSDVFSHPITQLHADNEHAHEKPIDWLKLLIGNCGHGDIYDPFAGSGATLIAALRLGRNWSGVEIESAMCDVILRRYTAETGDEPKLLERIHGTAAETAR